MSKRAEEAALKAYPVHSVLIQPARRGGYYADNHLREGFINGYKQAEKETIEKAAKWIRDHWREYILGPDADGCIGFGLWENDFRKAMEEDNG